MNRAWASLLLLLLSGAAFAEGDDSDCCPVGTTLIPWYDPAPVKGQSGPTEGRWSLDARLVFDSNDVTNEGTLCLEYEPGLVLVFDAEGIPNDVDFCVNWLFEQVQVLLDIPKIEWTGTDSPAQGILTIPVVGSGLCFEESVGYTATDGDSTCTLADSLPAGASNSASVLVRVCEWAVEKTCLLDIAPAVSYSTTGLLVDWSVFAFNTYSNECVQPALGRRAGEIIQGSGTRTIRSAGQLIEQEPIAPSGNPDTVALGNPWQILQASPVACSAIAEGSNDRHRTQVPVTAAQLNAWIGANHSSPFEYEVSVHTIQRLTIEQPPGSSSMRELDPPITFSRTLGCV